MSSLRREGAATLREVSLMPRDLSPVVPRARPGDDIVVLIHGFLASAGVWRPMRTRIERETGAHVASFSYLPGARVPWIARMLSRLVERLPFGARVHVVGHSLGGLAARWFVQEEGGHRRVAQTISLATPFGGATIAERIPILVGRDLRAESGVLRRLRATAHWGSVPHTSVVAGEDRLVVGKERATFVHGDVVHLEGRGHNSLLYDDEAVRVIVQRIRGFVSRSKSPLV